MMTPSWILDILAAVMLLVAAVSAGRLVAARPWAGSAGDADLDGAHLLMGIAMAGMLVASLTTLPNDAWDVIFAVMTAWFGWQVYRESGRQGARVLADGHHMPHLVHSAAMLYMFVALTAPAAGGGGGMGGGSGMAMQTLNAPVVAFIFILWLSAYVVLDLDRLSGPAHAHGSYFAGMRLAGATAGAGPGGSAALYAESSAAGTEAGTALDQAIGGSHTVGDDDAAGGVRPATGSTFLLSPKVAAGCRTAMGITMAFMLVIMI